MKSIIFSFISLGLALSAFQVNDNSLPKSAWKRIDKEIVKIWPELTIEKEHLDTSELSLYRLTVDEVLQGYLLISKAPSRYDQFDYMLLYSPELKILSAQILVYRESYGGEIASWRWLRQFIGLSNENTMKLGDDIQGISGATISCQAATNGFKESTILINAMKLEGKL